METNAWFAGLAFSFTISYAAYRKRSFSFSGMTVATGMGTLLFALGDLRWYGLMIAFFLSSSMLTHYKKEQKAPFAAIFDKTGERDGWQVLANGGVPLLLLLISRASGEPALLYAMYTGAIAAVNSDTWATEVGLLRGKRPVSILTFRPVPPGSSGGVSAWGVGAAVAGAVFIGLCSWIFGLFSESSAFSFPELLAFALCGGVGGAWLDSFLGATVQRMNKCLCCGAVTEKVRHCGAATEICRGIPWMNNDLVNASASLAGALAAGIIASFAG
ncbi:DUF92 domain-containing protein [Bacillaceae bacterium]